MSPRPVACAYALIVTVLRAMRSVVSRSSETGETFPPNYMCMHSACLESARCTMVFSQLIYTLKGIHVHYHCLLPLKGNMNVSFRSGGVSILRWFLVYLQASSTVLLTLFLPLCRRPVVTTCLRKVKHRITASLRVPRLAVPPLSLTVSTRNPMFARLLPSFPGMPMSVRAL